MISSREVSKFMQLFKGRNASYVKNFLPKEMKKGEKTKTKIITVNEKITSDIIEKHLAGEFGVGVSPITQDNKCFFGVIDIDYYKAKIRQTLDIIRNYNLPLLPFRSKSGGLHLYLMLSHPVTPRKMIDLLNRIIDGFALKDLYGENKVEVFPKQDKNKGNGSSITLPYFSAENTYTYLLDLDSNKLEFKDALNYIQKNFTSEEKLTEVLESLPYNDAPPCLQRILLSESVGKEDSGRNNFLFSFAIYCKKKYGTGFEKYVREVNNSFNCPISEEDLDNTINSVKENEYMYACKNIPLCSFCNKQECKNREYGLGRSTQSHFTGVDFGQLYRYCTAEPYYIWKLRLQGQEDWKDVIFKDEGFLLEQKNFAKMCVRYLNQAPMQVKANDWYAILNTVLPNIQNVEVKQESDTSSTNALRNALMQYLANKQARRDTPYQIRVGLCVRQEKKGQVKYYFTHQGFQDYLRSQKITFDNSLMREMLQQFGAREDKLIYTNAVEEVKEFPCWSMEDSKELEDIYLGNKEVEDGDKNSISEASNTEVKEVEDKLYTDNDKEEAEEWF